MNVFEAFPRAVVSGWSLVEKVISTEIGKTFVDYGGLDVILDDVASASENTPNADTIENDVLIYVKPAQLPTLKTKELLGGYMVADADGTLYEIRNVGIAKNQHSGTIEHVELLLRETEAPYGSES